MARKGNTDAERPLSSAERRRRRKEEEAEQRRLDRKKETLETSISRIEAEIAEIEEQMQREDVMTDHIKLAELSERLSQRRCALDKNYEEWLELQG